MSKIIFGHPEFPARPVEASMAERSFAREVEDLKLGAGQEFRGEGILAITKALLQSGVGYVAGYQGAPISHLMDVLSDAQDILSDLGVHFETSASEATAAATLAASVMYPIRGAVTFKSPVGTNVASDALANLASGGVTGGALIIVGEDYGEGSSIMQERSHACHVRGSFRTKTNQRPTMSVKDALETPRRDTGRVVLPPASYVHEKEKIEKRWPAAVKFIEENKLNEFFDGDLTDIGIVMQGGMYNTTLRALELSGLADSLGHSRVPLYILNVTYPLIDRELIRFAQGKRAILIVEEGQPEFIEQAVNTILRRADIQTAIEGKGLLPMAGEYTGGVVRDGVKAFVRKYRPDAISDAPPSNEGAVRLAAALKGAEHNVHPRPPSFCTGCPERPIFTALKLVERELGAHHVSCDIGCHLFSILPPFNIGNTTMGYGLGGAGAAALNAKADKRAIAFLGDGGFWHNGLTSSIGNAVFNKSDNVHVIVDNGYTP